MTSYSEKTWKCLAKIILKNHNRIVNQYRYIQQKYSQWTQNRENYVVLSGDLNSFKHGLLSSCLIIYHRVILSRIENFNVKITHAEKLTSSCLFLLKLTHYKEKSLTQICTNWSYSKLAKLALPNKRQSELNEYFSCITQLTLHLSFHFLNVTSVYHLEIFARLY